MQNKFNQNPLAGTVKQLVEPETSLSALELQNVSWESLNEMRNELLTMGAIFAEQVRAINSNQTLIKYGGEEKIEKLKKLIENFDADFGKYTDDIEEISAKHSGKTGKIVSYDVYDEFTKISFEYMGKHEQFIAIVTPSFAAISEVVFEIEDSVKNNLETQQEETRTDEVVVDAGV